MISSKIDGRIRAQDEKLTEKRFSKDICAKLRKFEGVNNVQTTELIGSLLVEYDPNIIQTSEVIVFLEAHIDCTESPPPESKGVASWFSQSLSTRSGKKGKSGSGGGQSGRGMGRGQGRSRQPISVASGSSLPINQLLKNALPFTDGNTLLSNVLKSLVSGAAGYQAFKFGRGRLGGGGGGKN